MAKNNPTAETSLPLAKLETEDVNRADAIFVSSFYIPKVVFWGFWLLLAIAVPFGFGLKFARDGVTIDNVYYTSMEFFRRLDYTSGQFATFGCITAGVAVFFIVVAVMWSRQKIWRWLLLLPLSFAQFINGFTYLMPQTTAHTFVVYGRQSWKVNAINIGILASCIAAIVCLLLYTLFVILSKKHPVFMWLTKKPVTLAQLLLLEIVALLLAHTDFILSLLAALPQNVSIT